MNALREWVDRPRNSMLLALVAAALLLIGGYFDTRAAFVAYLIGWLFVLGLCLGAMAMRMVHALTGGKWGEVLRPAMGAAMAALPLLALLALPLFSGLHYLFEWARPDVVAASDLLQKKAWYLNVPFFVVRTIVALLIWNLLARRLIALDRSIPRVEAHADNDTSEGGHAEPRSKSIEERAHDAALHRTSIAGLMLYTLSLSWFAVDWIMSLTPQWSSTNFGLLIAMGQAVGGFALVLWIAARYASRGEADADPQTFNDLGNIAMTLVLTWAYLAFTQYLVIWIGDLPHDISWYVPRVQTSWRMVAMALIVLHFAAPFCVLLFRGAKRRPRVMAIFAAGLVLAHWIDVLWLIGPAFHPQGAAIGWMEIVATLGIGAATLAWVRAGLSPSPQRGASMHNDSLAEVVDHG